MFIKAKYIIVNLIFMCKAVAWISVVDKGILPLEANSIGIKFFIDITNVDRENICSLYSRCKKCCLTAIEKEDCDVMTAFGEVVEIAEPRDRKTLVYVAPLIKKHDLVGDCYFLLNYNCNNKNDNIDVTIPFDTRVGIKSSKALMDQYIGTKKISFCDNLDEDSLANCLPVDCNMKYLDKRPIFDHNLKKCTEAPICLSNPEKELPDYVYVPIINICRNLDLPVTVQDIYGISSGLGTVSLSSESSMDVKAEIFTNCSTISQNLKFLCDLINGKFNYLTKGVVVDYTGCIKTIFSTIAICIISVCAVLFLLVFCVNTAVWFYIQWSEGHIKRMWKNVKKYFEKRKRNKCVREKVNSTIRNALLREVIVRDIPIELRNSVLDVCDRVEREVANKKRYRTADIGSQISLEKERDNLISSVSSSSSENENGNRKRSCVE